MRKKREKLFSKILVLTFLVLVILGFTVPGFINSADNVPLASTQAEPRLCNTDADCYLSCGDNPEPSACVQNLCQKNSCSEGTLYTVLDQPLTFSLDVEVNGTSLDFSTRINTQNFLTTFSGNQVSLFAKNFQLEQLFERLNLKLDDECIYVDNNVYCNSQDNHLTMQVNGAESLAYANYVPQQDDQIKIVYQKIEP